MGAHASEKLPKWIPILEYIEDEHQPERFSRKEVRRSLERQKTITLHL